MPLIPENFHLECDGIPFKLAFSNVTDLCVNILQIEWGGDGMAYGNCCSEKTVQLEL